MTYKTYTKKQAGVIYRAYKDGKITMANETVSALYNFVGSVEVLNTNAHKQIEEMTAAVKNAVDAIFANDYTTAQTSMDNFANA